MLALAEKEVNIEESTTPQLESFSFKKLQTGTMNKPAIKISTVAGLQKKIVSVDPRPLVPILQDNNSLTVPQPQNERVRFLNMNINTNDIDVIESQ